MVNKREAEELLMIEEADAWFEYLEATRNQSETATARSSRGPGRASTSGCARSARAAPSCARPRPRRADRARLLPS